jgi:4-hydroxy-3-polyprenylbenzoate decarboxylase
METSERAIVFVGITGASGSLYGIRAIGVLLDLGYRVHACSSRPGSQVLAYETGIASLEEFRKSLPSDQAERLSLYGPHDFFAPAASGSNRYDAVIIIPCSTSTLAHVAYGTTTNLIHRAADCALKQKAPVVLVVRETPLSLVHLRAMVAAAEAGATILPASPAFYTRPKHLDDAIDFVVGKALEAAGIDHDLYPRWASEEGTNS